MMKLYDHIVAVVAYVTTIMFLTAAPTVFLWALLSVIGSAGSLEWVNAADTIMGRGLIAGGAFISFAVSGAGAAKAYMAELRK